MKLSLLIKSQGVLYYKTDLFLKPKTLDTIFFLNLDVPLGINDTQNDTENDTQCYPVDLDELLLEWHRLAYVEYTNEILAMGRNELKKRLADRRCFSLERFFHARDDIKQFIGNQEVIAELEIR